VRPVTESPEPPFELAAFAFLLAAGAFAVLSVLALGRSPAAPLWFASGAYACFLLGRLDALAPRPTPDYIHSGSAAFLTICALILWRFIRIPAIVACLLPLPALFFEFYTRRFLAIGRRDLVSAGVALNAIFGVLALFLFRADPRFDPAVVSTLFSGLAGSSIGGLAAPAVLFFTCTAAHVFIRRAAAELALLSYGRAHFEGAGLRYETARTFLLCARGAFTAISFLSAGWMAGTAPYGPEQRGANIPPARDIAALAQYLCFAELLLFVSALAAPLIVVPLWFAGTGGLFMYKNLRRIFPYD